MASYTIEFRRVHTFAVEIEADSITEAESIADRLSESEYIDHVDLCIDEDYDPDWYVTAHSKSAGMTHPQKGDESLTKEEVADWIDE